MSGMNAGKRQRESEETLPRKVADAEDILGKSTFSLCHSTPQVPEKTETVKPESEAGTFATESERYPRWCPPTSWTRSLPKAGWNLL